MSIDINRLLKLWLGFYLVANSDVGEGKKQSLKLVGNLKIEAFSLLSPTADNFLIRVTGDRFFKKHFRSLFDLYEGRIIIPQE